MWPVKAAMNLVHMQSNRPAVPIQQIGPQEDDKNCHHTKIKQPVKPAIDMQPVTKPAKVQSKYKKKDQVKFNQVSMSDDMNCQVNMNPVCSDKKCQDTMFLQTVKPKMDIQLPKPAVPYQYKRLCSDKNCQSTRCYKKKNSDKNCQSDNNMCSDKNKGHLWVHMQTAMKISDMW